MGDELAILGGTPVLNGPLPSYNSIGAEEVRAVTRVMESGCLSGFYGSWSDEFFGGPMVRAFEAAWSERFQVKHSVSVNSATSGLFAAMGAIGIAAGDEVIVPPFTMSATVVAPLIYGGIPVFVDIEPDTFCLDLEAVSQAITSRTKAIIAVNLFGHPARLSDLRALADRHGIWLVEDNAQGPLSTEFGRHAGTIGHIGVFSLNYHKHIHTGEGGVCVTNDDDLARRLQLIRNHGESVVGSMGIEDISNIIGFNYRMTELSAAVGVEQLKKIDEHVERRQRLAEALTDGICDLAGLTPPNVRPDCRHVYYVWALRYDEHVVGVSRETFSSALAAEGFPHAVGYTPPLYMLPIFQRRIALGNDGYPFNSTSREYFEGMCPVTENMFNKELIIFEPCAYDINHDEIERLIAAIRKVYLLRGKLAVISAS